MKRYKVLFTGALIAGLLAMVMVMRADDAARLKKLETMENKGFAVVELFTSEGCSSCPPADEFMERLEKSYPNKNIYILAFHVDYWDHQGWKDRFSDRAYSERQTRYANWLSLSTIYTPQVVVNGTSEYVGSNERTIVNAISKGLEDMSKDSLTLKSRKEGNKLYVSGELNRAAKGEELVLGLVQKSADSNVKAGENMGRHLSHVQIVRQLAYGDINGKEKEITLPDDFGSNNWELIGFTQRNADGRITAAARINIEK